MSDPVTRPSWRAALLRKYRWIEALRAAPRAPDATLRELAAAFPGALRELDDLAPDTLRARIAALEAGDHEAPWMKPMAAYHGWLRVGLGAKRAAGRRRDAAAAQRWIASRSPEAGDPEVNPHAAGLVAELLRPAGRRLSAWVMARLAADHGMAAGALEALLFPSGVSARAPQNRAPAREERVDAHQKLEENGS